MRVYNKECDCGICGICTGGEEIHQDDKIKGELLWQKHTLEEVFNFFVENYSVPVGKKIVSHENFVDTQKGQVVFRLYLYNPITSSTR